MQQGRISLRIILGLGVLAVAGFVGAYLLFFTDDAPPPLTLSDQTSSPSDNAAVAPAPGAGCTTSPTVTTRPLPRSWPRCRPARPRRETVGG